jgi:hypothetical protein
MEWRYTVGTEMIAKYQRSKYFADCLHIRVNSFFLAKNTKLAKLVQHHL